MTLVAWTLPLAAAYAFLGGLRRLDEVFVPAGPVGDITGTACAAADRLQAGSRMLQYSQDCDQWDMRALYFLCTIEMVGIYTPLVYGLLPAALLKLSGPSMVCPPGTGCRAWWRQSRLPKRVATADTGWLHTWHPLPVPHVPRCLCHVGRYMQGLWFNKAGFFAPTLLQVPLLALSVATAVGAAEVLRTFGDSIDQDARRDSTQDIDSLFNVEDASFGSIRGLSLIHI